jgi:RNA polymerase sigma-32 factor
MNDSSTSRYIDRVRKIPLLDRETEHALAVKAAAGDEEARHQLVQANLRFVVAIALKYRRYGIRLGDLIAEGNLGLAIAARKFDADRGTRFVTYAGYWVRALVLDLVVRSTTMVGAGSGPLRSKLFFRLRRERAKVGNLDLTPEERIKELALKFETTEEKMEDLLFRLDARDIALDAPVRTDGDATMLDTMASNDTGPEVAVAAGEVDVIRRESVRDALSILDERERFILEQRYMGDVEVSLADLGRALGVSRERARQLEARAKEKMKARLGQKAELIAA